MVSPVKKAVKQSSSFSAASEGPRFRTKGNNGVRLAY